MILTNYGKEMMGFSKPSESDQLEIKFGIIHVYSLQGVNFHPDSEQFHSEVFQFGRNCTVTISNSINKACQLLTGDNFFDESEEEWIKKKKVTPPFVLIYFKEFKTRTLKGGYRKGHNGNIITYDAFPEGKEDIRIWEKESLPNIVTSLVVNFSNLDRLALLNPVKRTIFGTTDQGTTVFDLKITGGAVNIIVSSGKTETEINKLALKSISLYEKLNYKEVRHLFSALNESDRLKQFLSYFLFIERYTHSHFKNLNYDKDVMKLFEIPKRLNTAANTFFEQKLNESKNLSQRFHWCSILKWHQINDQDVRTFLEIKKIRDRLSHGEDIKESELPVEKIQQLSLKLLGTA